MALSSPVSFKVVLLGEGAVGKTSLVLRYVENKFQEKHITTLQASFFTKQIKIRDTPVKIAIWDTAGQERFHALGPIYYRDSHGAVLVYDITDEDSFYRVKNWVNELRTMLGPELPLVIAGNKVDLEKDRNISRDDATTYAESVGAKHFDTSAKTSVGVTEMFQDLSLRMLIRHEATAAKNGPQQSGRPGITVVDDTNETDSSSHRRSGCC